MEVLLTINNQRGCQKLKEVFFDFLSKVKRFYFFSTQQLCNGNEEIQEYLYNHWDFFLTHIDNPTAVDLLINIVRNNATIAISFMETKVRKIKKITTILDKKTDKPYCGSEIPT